MAAMSRLLPLAAFSTFAIFLLALLATPTNALATEQYGHVARGHGNIAKRKRSAGKLAKRCRPKSTTLAAATSSSSAYATSSTNAPSYSAPPATTSPPKTSTSSSVSVAPTSSAVTPVYGSGGGIYGNGKKLIYCWANGGSDLAKWKSDRVAGIYTWSPYCPSNMKDLGAPCWQMLWGTKQKSDFAAQTKANGPSDLIFAMNEPNQHDQSNISPQDAAGIFKEMIQPFRSKGSRFVAPAPTSAPDGIVWVQDFLNACSGCTIDFIALHYYDVSVTAFKKYVTNFYEKFGKPIIVSEYACQNFNGGDQCTPDETWKFHQEMRDWFESTSWIAAYAPFGMMHDMVNVNPDNQMMTSDGYPNALGRMYLSG